MPKKEEGGKANLRVKVPIVMKQQMTVAVPHVEFVDRVVHDPVVAIKGDVTTKAALPPEAHPAANGWRAKHGPEVDTKFTKLYWQSRTLAELDAAEAAADAAVEAMDTKRGADVRTSRSAR
mmetsp:Transcript_74330/g.240297  ORF Transcript_74330/g.240297 Transcript_74330/m.240297 type:complete len:121 (-) Transcript_74330:63-425(-)